jgi:hypothetical protein
MFTRVANFQSLLTTPFVGSTNALCWERVLPGDYAEVVAKLGPGEGLVALDEERLRGLGLSAKGQVAVEQMLADLALLRDAGRDPVLNIIYGYDPDEDPTPFARDVFSWHVDSILADADASPEALAKGDTWLCTYHGAPSEGLPNDHALRKVDDPTIRAQLLAHFGGEEGEAFEEWLTENHYDLHYSTVPPKALAEGGAPKPGAQPYSFGQFNLWRAACAWPGSPVPPCVHRAPVTDAPRLLLIS